MAGSRVRRRWGWLALGMVLVVAFALGWPRTPTSGDSDDRLYALSGELKCLQCVGETVANSQAPIAVEIRTELRKQMRSGKTDDEIRQYFVDRYGEQVLLTPSGSGLTGVVWIVPVVALAAGVVGLGLAFGRWRSQREDTPEVSDADRDLVAKALADQTVADRT